VMILILLALYGIDSILAQPELRNAQCGVCIIDLASDSVVFARNSQKLLIPASNMKIVSTAASLCYLGSGYRYNTRFGMQGTVKGNTLDGDLIVIGGGDPTLTSRSLEQFVRTLGTRQIKTVTGNIIIDDDFFTELSLHGNGFTYERLPVGWAWHYLDARYAAEISALSLDKNYVNVIMEPTSPGDDARVRIEPETEYVRLVSRMKTVQDKDSIIIYRTPGTNIIYVDGGIGDKRARSIPVSVMDPARFAGYRFRELLRDAGITVRGNVVMLDEYDKTAQPSGPRILIDSILSPPLIDILQETNVESVNLYAETLLKTLGAR
jgi:D-alanyl-D-alanine carboxypeptidase/D-alanyl-D-alanine-endopeptidase (penicillin-binding protein 4)